MAHANAIKKIKMDCQESISRLQMEHDNAMRKKDLEHENSINDLKMDYDSSLKAKVMEFENVIKKLKMEESLRQGNEKSEVDCQHTLTAANVKVISQAPPSMVQQVCY